MGACFRTTDYSLTLWIIDLKEGRFHLTLEKIAVLVLKQLNIGGQRCGIFYPMKLIIQKFIQKFQIWKLGRQKVVHVAYVMVIVTTRIHFKAAILLTYICVAFMCMLYIFEPTSIMLFQKLLD